MTWSTFNKIWTPKNVTIANFGHPVSKSWLRLERYVNNFAYYSVLSRLMRTPLTYEHQLSIGILVFVTFPAILRLSCGYPVIRGRWNLSTSLKNTWPGDLGLGGGFRWVLHFPPLNTGHKLATIGINVTKNEIPNSLWSPRHLGDPYVIDFIQIDSRGFVLSYCRRFWIHQNSCLWLINSFSDT